MTPNIRSIVVCVNFDDYLAITLPLNLRVLNSVCVVTAVKDRRTQELTRKLGCNLHITDAFYRNGAKFNKGLAIEEAFSVIGGEGWICVWDVDIVMPKSIEIPDLDETCLYVPRRRDLPSPNHDLNETNWQQLPCPTQEDGFDGYFQLFHAPPPFPRPWYGVDSPHAGRCDSDFSHKYPTSKKKRPPWDVLHLGESGPCVGVGKNWEGRVTPRIDGSPVHCEKLGVA